MKRPTLWSHTRPLRRYALTIYMVVAPLGIVLYALQQLEAIPSNTLTAATKIFIAGIILIMFFIVGGVFTVVLAVESIILDREIIVADRVRADRVARGALNATRDVHNTE